ncbi:MAG: hypothetical protein IPN59_09175 [Holophaga sp.]|nr:hypothetical protein [Holophaga sp.]
MLGSRGSVVPIFREQIERRRSHHRDPSGHDPLLHDHPRGQPAGAAGRAAGHQRQGVRAGYGRARAHRGSGHRHDSPFRPGAGPGYRNRLFRQPPGRKAL